MKSMKKLVTLLLSLVMLCALAMPAMAAETTYSITINGAKDHTYTAYQVFKGVYYKEDGAAGKEYLSDVQWGDNVNDATILTALQASPIIGSDFTDKKSAEDVAYVLQRYDNKSEKLDEFARIVGENLKAGLAGKSGKVSAENSTATISGLTAGYYFVKDTGTINDGEIATKFLVKVVGNANANVTVKAQAPTFDKKIVKKNGDTVTTVTSTSANVGDTVTFRLTANVPDMASFGDYTFTMHDTLSDGLTFDANSVTVTANNNAPVAAGKYALNYNEGDQNFTITFTKAQLKDLVSHTGGTGEDSKFGATIVVEYTATLNKNALNKDVETNKAYLEYTNDPSNNGTKTTPEITVYVYDFDLTVDKYDGTDGTATGKKLENAVFVLYRLKDATTREYYKCDDTTGEITWVPENDNPTQKTTDVYGKTTFEGLKEGTYYLKEITAPSGYNTLKEPVEVKIIAAYNAGGTLDPSLNTECKLKQDSTGKHYYQVQSIANKAGAVLPSTGGIGTTIFYVLGSILALGAAVLLIVKKRMNGQDR